MINVKPKMSSIKWSVLYLPEKTMKNKKSDDDCNMKEKITRYQQARLGVKEIKRERERQKKVTLLNANPVDSYPSSVHWNVFRLMKISDILVPILLALSFLLCKIFRIYLYHYAELSFVNSKEYREKNEKNYKEISSSRWH